jgi:hypothetical protein
MRACVLATIALAMLGACSDPPPRVVSMDYASLAFWAAPFPGEHLRREDGTIDVSHAPNPFRTTIVQQIHQALVGIDGFGTSAPIHFPVDGPIDESLLPDRVATLDPSSPLLLVDVDADSPERGRLRPFEASFQHDAGPYAEHLPLLTLLPVQGMPLRAGTLYAAIVTDRLRGARGEPFAPSPAMRALREGRTPPGMSAHAAAAFASALEVLRDEGFDLDRFVAITVFRTGDPTRTLRDAVRAIEGRFAMSVVSPPEPREVFDDYCVFEGRVRMPVFQRGVPPFLTEGGEWVLDERGVPQLQREEDARIWVTVPRTAMPEAGFPVAVLVRTGAGADRALVDRGRRALPGGPPEVAGTGPALEFARAGFAGISVDGPHGGIRNAAGGDEQFLVFNIQNPIALRDNLRQSALELVLLARALETLEVDAASCPGLVTPYGDVRVRFDAARIALMGHSMGASIAPLAAAFEPRFGALILSGAGGSWIENVIHKERPIATRPAAEALLRYTAVGRRLTSDDPVLGMLQWAGESADAQIYARLLVEEAAVGPPRHVLMFQGIVDHYILPPIANALSLALAVDRAGPGLDATHPDLSAFTPIEELLPLRGRRAIDLPAAGNVQIGDRAITAVVVQHAEDGIEDGHETVFQTEPPKMQYRCFLRTFARGAAPRIPDPSAPDAACD